MNAPFLVPAKILTPLILIHVTADHADDTDLLARNSPSQGLPRNRLAGREYLSAGCVECGEGVNHEKSNFNHCTRSSA